MENDSNPHHLVLGQITDFLSGSVIADTHDERYRQKIARMLVLDCKFEKYEISANYILDVIAGKRKAGLKVDFLVCYQEKTIALIKYAPGSLVTRRLSTLALSRIIKPYQIPVVVITNGEDAEIIDGETGKVIANGLENLPTKDNLKEKMTHFSFNPIKNKIFDQASRIAYACEVDGACPCDSDICIIE